MESKKPSVFVKTYEEGINRVLEGNYAFLMESTMLDYAVQRDCNLTQIGGLLDSKGYGIATPKGSEWRDKISLAILELQEKGVIQILYDKWWKNTGDVCNRDDKSKDSKANALGVENIGNMIQIHLTFPIYLLCCALLLLFLLHVPLVFLFVLNVNAFWGRARSSFLFVFILHLMLCRRRHAIGAFCIRASRNDEINRIEFSI